MVTHTAYCRDDRIWPETEVFSIAKSVPTFAYLDGGVHYLDLFFTYFCELNRFFGYKIYAPVFVGVGSLTAYLNPQCMLVSVCFHNLVTYA
jgi:hypothetical protein